MVNLASIEPGARYYPRISSIIDPRPIINFIAIENPADQFVRRAGGGEARARPGAREGEERRRPAVRESPPPAARHGRAAPRPLTAATDRARHPSAHPRPRPRRR